MEAKAEFCPYELRKSKLVILADNTFRPLVFICLNIVTMFAFLILMRRFLFSINYFSKLSSNLLPLSFVLIMPIFYEFPNYIYDFSHLLLFTAGLYFLYKQNWLAYTIIFPLAILNKESALMLTIIFAYAYYKKLPFAFFMKLVLYQMAIFIIIKAILYFVFWDNPGTFVEWHLGWNLDHLLHIPNFFKFVPIGQGIFLPFDIKIPWSLGLNLPLLSFVAFLVIYKWKAKPLLLRQATIYFPLLLIMAMTMGLISELRAYYDVLPIAFILGAIGFAELINDLKTRFTRGDNVG